MLLFFILPGIIWLDNVNCSGAEAKLTDCGTAGWGRHNCRNSEAAGVKCLARKEPVMLADTASEKTEKVFYGIPRIPPPSVNQVHRFSQSYFEVHLISTLKFWPIRPRLWIPVWPVEANDEYILS